MFRKLPLLLFLLIGFNWAQIFNSADIIKPKQTALAINPVLLNDLSHDDAGMFLHAEYGLGSAMQLSGQLGMGFDETYVGIMVEKSMINTLPLISLAAGIHSFKDIGIDAVLNISVPVNKVVMLYGGLDTELLFAEKKELNVRTLTWETKSDTRFLTWFFLGMELPIGRNMHVLAEIEIGIAEEAYNLFGTGLKFYL